MKKPIVMCWSIGDGREYATREEADAAARAAVGGAAEAEAEEFLSWAERVYAIREELEQWAEAWSDAPPTLRDALTKLEDLSYHLDAAAGRSLVTARRAEVRPT